MVAPGMWPTRGPSACVDGPCHVGLMAAPLRWNRAHDHSPAFVGYAGAYLVARVAFYDVVAGGRSGCVGYVQGHRITGRCRSAHVAQLLVEERREMPMVPRPTGVR